MNFTQVYDRFLRLFPEDYSRLFAAEMSETFARAVKDSRRLGCHHLATFAVCESVGLVKLFASEWIGRIGYSIYRSARLEGPFSVSADLLARLTNLLHYCNASFRSRYGPDLRMMRPAGISRDCWYSGNC